MDSTNKVHDALSGFHDIKALGGLGQSTENAFSLSSALLGAFVTGTIVLLFFIIRKLRSPRRSVSPFEQFQAEITRLQGEHERRESLPRNTAVQLSERFREFLQAVFVIPAPELTPREILERLPTAIAKSFPSLDSKPFKDLIERSLRALEFLSFAPEEIIVKESARLECTFRDLRELLSQLRFSTEQPKPSEEHVPS